MSDHPHYTVGMTLSGDDLRLQQCYLAEHDRGVRRELHGYGTVVVEDGDGVELGRYALGRHAVCVDGGAPLVRFSGTLPVLEGAATARFLADGADPGGASLVVDLTVPPPVVDVVEGPRDGDLVDGRLDLLVRVGGGTGPSTRLAVRISRDGGATFVRAAALASHREGDLWDVEVALEDGAGSDACVVQVQATSGLVPGTAVTGRFAVRGAGPQLVVTSPVDGATCVADAPLVLAARVLRPVTATGPDGSDVLGDSTFRWTSDLSGPLGTGSPLVVTLPPGQHSLHVALGDLTALVGVAVG